MPGINNRPLTGYFETAYENPWPGLCTNLPTSQIPPGACSSCNATVLRGHLQPQPAIFGVTGTGGMTVTMPTLAPGENVCAIVNDVQVGGQQGFTVLITNSTVYISYVLPTTVGTVKAFTPVFTFPTAYPRYARFGSCVIGNTLYFSSASQLGLYALRPVYSVASVEITNPGNYFTSAPAVVFADGAGTGAAGTAHLSGAGVGSVTMTDNGIGYVSPPIVYFNGGATGVLDVPQIATAVGVLSTYPTNYIVQEVSAFTGIAYLGFSGTYTGATAPVLAFIGGGGTGASGQVALNPKVQGTAMWVQIGSFGQNYTSVPTVQIIDPTGSGSYTITVTLFNGKPFIGGDFMAAMNNRLLLGNIIGGDGNNTTSIVGLVGPLPDSGSGYTSPPIIDFLGGGGAGASAYSTLNVNGGIGPVGMGTTISFTGIISNGSPNITGVTSVTGIVAGMSLSDGGYGISPGTKVVSVTNNANLNTTGTFAAGSTSITSVASITGVLPGQPIAGQQVASGTTVVSASGSTIVMSQGALSSGSGVPLTVVLGNTIDMSANATESTTEGITAYGFVYGNYGNGYYAQPQVGIYGNSTSTPTIFAQLSNYVLADSSQTRYRDRIAWSAPNAYNYFDPNYLVAPGGYNTLSEAKGLITSVNVIESVAFIGHNGGITEMTPNTSSGQIPFAFYPLWSSDQGVLVRYGSMAQYGTTLAFLALDTAYTMTPNGLSEIGQNIANQLQNAGLWNNGNYSLQGLYGSIVLIEGQKHYLIGLSSDDWDLQNGSAARQTTIYDFNMNENSWHQWQYAGYTLTCPIYQSFDTALYSPSSTTNNTQIARDSWLLAGFTVSTGNSAPYGEEAAALEMATLARTLQLIQLGTVAAIVYGPGLAYQWRTEAPSIARMQQQRRFGIEYENLPLEVTLGIEPELTFVYTGQQDPTDQTTTISQQETITRALVQLATPVIAGQVLTTQADFGTFTGVCTSLGMTAGGVESLVSLVRITQIASLPKGELP